MKRLLALTAAMILLCGVACAGYSGTNYYLILFEVLLEDELGYSNLREPVEKDEMYIYTIDGLVVYIFMDNETPTCCIVTAKSAQDSDALMVAYIASYALAGKSYNPLSAYIEYRKTGNRGWSFFDDGWYFVVDTNSSGELSCTFMKPSR